MRERLGRVAVSSPPAGGLDFEAALEWLGGDFAILAQLAEVFSEEAPALLRSMERAIRAKDSEELLLAACSMKSTLTLFEASEVAGLAARIETIAVTQNWPAAPAAYEELVLKLREPLASLGHFLEQQA